jgi:hypothetical protein
MAEEGSGTFLGRQIGRDYKWDFQGAGHVQVHHLSTGNV